MFFLFYLGYEKPFIGDARWSIDRWVTKQLFPKVVFVLAFSVSVVTYECDWSYA